MNGDLCSATLFAGDCETLSCTLRHNFKFCNVCAIICSPSDVYTAHVRGRQHRSNLAAHGPSTWLLCSLCNISVPVQIPWAHHITTASHRQVAFALGTSPAVYPCDPNVPNAYRCIICQRAVDANDWVTHLLSVLHLRQQRASLLRANFEKAEQDRRGVRISHVDSDIDFGIISRSQARSGLQIDVTVECSPGSSSMSILKVGCFSSGNMPTTPFSSCIVGGPSRLIPGRVYRVLVTFRHRQRGRFQGRLELTFQDATKRTSIVVRQLRAVVGNREDRELLRAAAPFVQRRPARWENNTSVVTGDPPPVMGAIKWVKPLLPFNVPLPLSLALSDGSSRDAIRVIRNDHLPSVVDPRSHGRYFQVLLWIEEHRLREDLRLYAMTDVGFAEDGRFYSLLVPGLAEKRPSVVVIPSMSKELREAASRTGGYVHAVRLEHILVHFHRSFDVSGTYIVRFSYNRTPIKRQHQALVTLSTSIRRLLFPLPEHAPLPHPLQSNDPECQLSLYNTKISGNAPQLQAVASVLYMRPGAAPFIIFGPPGTGKTVTVSEAILQLLRKPDTRILACAPSNSAADLLAQRLAPMLSPTAMLRCNATFRDRATFPGDLEEYCTWDQDRFALPPLSELQKYRVIVSTCSNASFAYNIGMPRGHFTHIFVDEAGQGSEPEVLTAGIKTMVSDETRVVLSGDPQQLGPVVRSAIARQLGLGKSYLERLMARPVYSDARTGRGRSFVKLVKNFRSHQAILAYPNERFYNGELEVCGAPSQTLSFLGSDVLVSPRLPVVFHAISGENEREASSPSYFNIDEATEVVEYVKDILDDHRHPVHPRDIGVITPYLAQARKIRMLLKREDINDLQVASVEEFQGQERRVIIISTVRTSPELLSYDAKFTLGFVSNPRRFNVAVTRAQALLVVVGDPAILAVDPMWRGFMNYVHTRGGWRGEPPTWDTTAPVRTNGTYAEEMREAAAAEMDTLIARLGKGEDVEGEANVDRAFGEVE
ncbi:P-loop containing nucleoside triphosphate hydrolase protein [Trametes polyzona]|nr:P-loop containing nucleoside triphosphate hydrolase protein [Trametes polyzona]